MKDTQLMIEESVTNYGLSDIRTLKLSKERNEEIAADQREIYNKWLKNR